MKKIILLAAILLSQNVEAKDDFFIVNCGRDRIMFPINTFPQGVSLSDWQICSCLKRNWRGPQCNIELKNKELAMEIDRKNNLIIDIILEGIKHK
jgi:hypothetical protein